MCAAGARISGSPAFAANEWLRAVTAFPKLPEMLKTLRELKKRVDELETDDDQSKTPPHGDRRPVAYLNEDFLNSPDARALRILAEFLEPLAHFRREKVRDTVVFFGSARMREDGPAGPLLRRRAHAGPHADRVGRPVHQQHLPFRGVLRRRSRHHGGRQPRRQRCQWQDRRAEYRAAVRAVPQPLHHARAELRVPLLLHAQVLVRLSGQGAGGVSRAASAPWTR